LSTHHIERSTGSAGAAANWQIKRGEQRERGDEAEHRQPDFKELAGGGDAGGEEILADAGFGVVFAFAGGGEEAPDEAQIQRVFQAAWMRAGCTSSGFSVALEISGSANGRAITAKTQIAQALRWKIVANVRRKSLMVSSEGS
jgi:hypothetical protein